MSKYAKKTTGLGPTTVGQTTRQVNSMDYCYGASGEAWTKQDEKDMAAASAQNSHVAFEEAFRAESRGLRNPPSEKDWAGAFGFNPAVSAKQQHFMGAELARKRAGRKTKTHMSEGQLADYARKG